MNILCMTYEYPPIGGGGASVAHPLAAALVERGHKVDVVTSGMRDLPSYEICDGVDVHRVRCFRRCRHYATTPELIANVASSYKFALNLVKRHDFDINHTHFALPSGLASYLLYKRTGLPYVLTIHGSDIPGYNPDRFRLEHVLARPLWRKIILNSSAIIAASECLKDLFHETIDVPVTVIPNGYTLTAEHGSLENKRKRILVVSRIFPRKGIQYFLESLVGLTHDWEVVIVGDGPYLQELKRQAARTGINVRFTGYQQGKALEDLYASSRIFVFPSAHENFPVVLLEAMEAGCAIITTNAPGCSRVIGDAGIVVDPESPDQIRDALVGLMADQSRIVKLGAMARERLGQFQWDQIAASYEVELRKAASGGRSTSTGRPTVDCVDHQG